MPALCSRLAAASAPICARAPAPSVTLTASARPLSGIALARRSCASQLTGGVTSAVSTKRPALSLRSRSGFGGVAAVMRLEFRRMRIAARPRRLSKAGKASIYRALHHTFYEMLGNFSFGDYFKDRAIELAWNLVTKEFGLAKDRLWVTVYPSDDEARRLWKKIANIPDERIVGHAENLWAMGPVG